MKNFAIGCSILIGMSLISCNGEQGKTTTDSASADTAAAYNLESFDNAFVNVCLDATGLANFIVDEPEGKDMITNFSGIYLKDDAGNAIRTIDPITWLDAKTISAILKYLRENNNDGVRIFMGSEPNPDSQYGSDQYKHKVKVLIIPTVHKASTDPTKTEHLTDLKSTLDQVLSHPNIESYTSTITKKNKFDEIYRKKPGTGLALKDSLSQSVWIDTCVLVAIHKLINITSANLDGVNINLAAYKTKDPKRPSQLYANQSTMLLIPTKPSTSGNGHENDWDAIDRLKTKIKIVPGALNHGELCPQKCD